MSQRNTPSEPLTEQAAGKRSALRWVLILSLGLNLVILGLAAGAFLLPHPQRGAEEHRLTRSDRVEGAGRGAERGAERGAGRVESGRAARGEGPPFLRALDPADRRALRQQLVEDGIGLQDGSAKPARRTEMRQQFLQLLELLRQEPLDKEGVEALLAGQEEQDQARRAAMRTAFLNQLAGMRPEARAAYADRLEAMLPPRR